MSVGADIASVYTELGVTATILRTPTNLTEKIQYEVNEQATNSFVREHHLNASFAYNTVIVNGDVLQFNSLSYLTTNITADDFQGSVVEYAAVLLKCNLPSTAKIIYWNQTQNATTFEITAGWTVRKSLAYGLIFHGVRNVLSNKDSFTGKDPVYELICMVPASYSVEKLDRVIVSSTEYYMVQDVEKYEFPGLQVLTLVEDTRAVYTS